MPKTPFVDFRAVKAAITMELDPDHQRHDAILDKLRAAEPLLEGASDAASPQATVSIRPGVEPASAWPPLLQATTRRPKMFSNSWLVQTVRYFRHSRKANQSFPVNPKIHFTRTAPGGGH